MHDNEKELTWFIKTSCSDHVTFPRQSSEMSEAHGSQPSLYTMDRNIVNTTFPYMVKHSQRMDTVEKAKR